MSARLSRHGHWWFVTTPMARHTFHSAREARAFAKANRLPLIRAKAWDMPT